MLLELLLLQLTSLTLANPFHKYPYVFLLDVGNEELEKVNTEQIRVSKQGGSLALRYPAIGNGEDIAHVRVSGIDFGTDLKANIVDGGPGYKYVVLVLMGNPRVNFEAVITIQTVPTQSDEVSLQNIDNTDNQESGEKDANDSAEDLSDAAESEETSQVSVDKNAEITQESSNIYSYAVNEALNGYGSNVHPSTSDEDSYEISENGDDIYSKQKDIHVPHKENDIQIESNPQLNYYSDDDDSSIENQSIESHNDADYASVLDDQNDSYNTENQKVVETDFYEQYDTSRDNPHYGDDVVYPETPQRFIPDDSGAIYIEEPGENNRALNMEEIFSNDYDEEDTVNRNYNDKNNNNYIESNGGSAIAY